MNKSYYYDRFGPWKPATDEFTAHMAEIGGTAVLVYLAILHHAGRDMTAWPSVKIIMKLTGLERKTVFNGLNTLENAGWIIRTNRFNNSNVYQIILSRGVYETALRGVPNGTKGCMKRDEGSVPNGTLITFSRTTYKRRKRHNRNAKPEIDWGEQMYG